MAWSARGDLAIGVGRSHKLIPGFQEREISQQPWDISRTTDDQFASDGRPKATSSKFTDSRRDADGFPSSTQESPGNGSQSKSRTFSPASFRHYPLELSTVRGDASVPAERTLEQPSRRAVNNEEGRKKVPRTQVDKPTVSRSKKHSLRAIYQIVEDDISMVMRHRVIRGYGIRSVCFHPPTPIDVCPSTLVGFPQCRHNARRSFFVWYIVYALEMDTSYVELICTSEGAYRCLV